jgi:hypothetical protein
MSFFGPLIILFVGVLLYLLPSMIASKRQHPSANSICIINIFFGWTLVGWVLCLAWSASGLPTQSRRVEF